MNEWVVPECLHVPIVAVDEQAIEAHIGDIVEVLSPGKALLVKMDPPPVRDPRLEIWSQYDTDIFFDPLQVWVSPGYTRYRKAYIRAKGQVSVAGKVVHHVYNRRMAVLRDYGFIRLVPISRGANSSSGYTEQWGVEHAAYDNGERRRKRDLRIQYADLGDLLVMLDVKLGGGVQEVVRLGQNLIEIPGKRPKQPE
ncbi:hypothetical protein C0039_15145 [Pseudohalioglobus lutimaris]|uniref:Uncharacterized protein n=2 Tax=Pseudohalioglobus lutimaris TaxID=1737061 RepID=A0A2N5WZU1_9GAMM|nr:hypothetical protein C0039_15145 [Pseudohalioglobus lutimaris]